MPKFRVTEVTEIRTTFIVDADNAHKAIRNAKETRLTSNYSPYQSIEEHFIANEIKEENK